MMVVTADILRGSFEQRLSNVLTLTVFTLIAVVLGVWAYRDWRHRGRPALAVLVLGGLATYLSEPIGAWLVGYRADPAANHPVLYHVAGTDVSIWMLTAYAVYVAGAAYVAYCALEQRWQPQRFWAWALGLTALEMLGELLWINVTRLFDYAAPQGLVLLGLPLMWPLTYIVTGMLAGTLVFFLSRNLRGARTLALLPIPAGAYAGTMLLCGWPSMLAHLGDTSAAVRDVAGLFTIAGLLALLYALTTQMGGSRPAPARPSPTAAPQRARQRQRSLTR